MSDDVRTFCNSVHDKLATLDGRMDSLKLNNGSSWHYLLAKLDEVRDRSEAHQSSIHQARIKLEQWCDDKRLEANRIVDDWRECRDIKKLAERAERTEVHARYAMQIAEASIDAAERMILEAITARRDAAPMRDDSAVSEIRHSVHREQTIRPMKSVNIMNGEHVVVERVLELLEQACDRIRLGEATPIGFKRWSIRFFSQFADRCHHSQESSTGSAAVQFRGVSSDGGPVGVMMSHHKQGRTYIQRMQLAADLHDQAGWSLLAKEYTLLLRQQFQHENRILQQMAEVCGTEEDHSDLAEIFRSVDRAQSDCELGNQFDTQIERWEQRFRRSAKPMPSIVIAPQVETLLHESKLNPVSSFTEAHLPRTIGLRGLDIVDCETDMSTMKTLMPEHRKLPDSTFGAGREVPRKSK